MCSVQAATKVMSRYLKAGLAAKFFKIGLEPVGSAPAQFASVIKAEMVKWGSVIKRAGIRAE